MRPLVGAGMVGMGVILMYGGVTGRLAPMLAALFVPSALTPSSASHGGIHLPNVLKVVVAPVADAGAIALVP